MPDRGLAAVEDALEVDREDALELLVGALGDHLVVRHARDVADDVDASVLRSGQVDERVDVGPLGHVGTPDRGDSAVGLDLVGRGPGARLVDVAAHDRGAGRRQHQRGRLADPAPDAGEHRHPVREIEQFLHPAHGVPLVRRTASVGPGAY